MRIIRSPQSRPCPLILFWFLLTFLTVTETAYSQNRELSERGKAADTNKDGLIQRSEARGPLEANFDDMDCDKNGGLDGAEIRGFFTGTGCPEKTASKPDNKNKKKQTASSGNRRPPPAVKLATVVSEIAGETYKVAGRVIALQSGSLSTRVSGTIKRISVEVGDRVTEGYIIAKLRDGRIRADRKKALALLKRQQVALKNAVRELNRIKRLRKSAAYSRARFEELEGQVAERRSQVSEVSAALERIEIDVRDTVIKAPFSGVITQKHVEKGTHVNTGSPIVTLINDNKVEIEVDVPSFRISSISSATVANLLLDNGTKVPIQVRSIIPREDLRTRTRPIRLRPTTNEGVKYLADNQAVLVELPLTGSQPIVMVPKDAVIKRANGNVAFVVKGENASMRSVRVGRGVGSNFEVLEGLKPGENVVIRGNERLGAGGQVRVVQ